MLVASSLSSILLSAIWQRIFANEQKVKYESTIAPPDIYFMCGMI